MVHDHLSFAVWSVLAIGVNISNIRVMALGEKNTHSTAITSRTKAIKELVFYRTVVFSGLSWYCFVLKISNVIVLTYMQTKF